VNSQAHYMNPAEAARRIGSTAKALRVYEQHGLLTPGRNAAGWRTYSPAEMSRAAEIVELRGLGFSLAQIARVLDGDARDLEPMLAAHQTLLEGEIRKRADTVGKIQNLRNGLAEGRKPTAHELIRLLAPDAKRHVTFDLPWPWGGERFELREIRALTYITGPLGSGKTRLAMRLAETLPNAAFLGLQRSTSFAQVQATLAADAGLKARVDRALAWIVEDGGVVSDALVILMVGLEREGPDHLVIDMIEQGLDHATQEALIAYLRFGRSAARPLFFLTRSSAILDLASVGPDEAIILCPANHSPPIFGAPYPGTPGYEAIATCLATPAVRARTEGVIAMRP